MRISRLSLFASSLAVAAIGFIGTNNQEVPEVPMNEHLAYNSLFEKKMSEFPRQSDIKNLPKKDRPDLAEMFDNLKRMDPGTGKVPPDGYLKAYQYMHNEWGISSVNKINNALEWVNRGPKNFGGRTRALMWDPNDSQGKAVFAGGVGGGLWHCVDVTVTNSGWQLISPLFANIAVTCVAHNPANTMEIYYGTGEGWGNIDQIRGAGIWKSADGGTTWNLLSWSDNSSFYNNQDIAVSSSGIVYFGSKSGLYRSDDGGQTVTKVLGSGTGTGTDWITDLEFDSNGNLFVGIHSSGIFTSPASLGTSQGTQGSWSKIYNTNGGDGRVHFSISQSDPSTIYGLKETGSGATVFKSTNSGSSWSNLPNPGWHDFSCGSFESDWTRGQSWYDLSIGVSPTDPNKIFVGGVDIFASSNGGSNWSQISHWFGNCGLQEVHADQHNVVFKNGSSNEVLFSNDGGVWYSSNANVSPGSIAISGRSSSYVTTQYYSLAIDMTAGSNIMLGGLQDNGSILTSQPGLSNGTEVTGGDGAYVAINRNNPNVMFTANPYEPINKSTNGGASFNNISNPALSESNTLWVNPFMLDYMNPNILYQGSSALWKHPNATTGGSGGWQQATAVLGSITAIGPSTTQSDLVYFAAGSSVYRAFVLFGGSTYVPPKVNPSGLPGGHINCIAVDPNDGNHIVVTFTNFGLQKHVLETRNADQELNATWKDLTGNLPDIPCNWAAFEPNNNEGLLVGTDMGVFRCGDISLAEQDIYWSPASNGLGYPRVEMIHTRFSDNSVHLSTHGRGVFSTTSYSLVPIAVFGAQDTMACGGWVQFIDSTYNAPTSWSWDFGDGNFSNYPNPLHQYASSGTYTVKLVVSNANGTDSTTSQFNVTVLSNPTAVAGPDINGCAGDTVWLSASGGVTYSWWPSTGLDDPSSANPYFVITGSRTFVVTVYDSAGCSDSDTTIVTQLSSPSIWAGQDQTINQGDSVQLQGSGGVSYEWAPATGLSCTNCPNPMASPSTTTAYTCTGTNSNGCSNTDNVTVFVNGVGVEEQLTFTGYPVKIFPNPANEVVSITFYIENKSVVTISLFDVRGKQIRNIFEGSMNPGEKTVRWSVSDEIAAGVYFVRIAAGDEVRTQKILIED